MHSALRWLANRLHMSGVLQRLRRLPYVVGVLLCRVIRRPASQRVLALSDSHATLQGNLACVAKAAVRAGFDVKCVLKGGLHARRGIRKAALLCWRIAGAGSIILDDFYPIIYPLKLSKRTRVIQLWHASGAFKTVGFSRLGKPGGPSPRSITHAKYTDAITSSPSIRANYAEAFKLPIERVHATGVPRTDVFFDETTLADTRQRIRHALQIQDGDRFVVFAPTFRGNGQLSAHFPAGLVDWTNLVAGLGPHIVVGIKRHPFVVAREPLTDAVAAHPQLRSLEDAWDMDDLLMAADVLVTDYSSVIFDFSLLNRPIVFHCPDLEDYTESRDFYYPFDRYLVGQVTSTTAQLVGAINDPQFDSSRLAEFRDFFCASNDGHATQRVLNELIAAPFDGWSNPR